MAFCDNLLFLRKKHNLTQEQLAEEFEVSRQAVSKWETGEAFPETEKLMQMCDKFGVTMDELLRGDVTEPRGESEINEAESSDEAAPYGKSVIYGIINSSLWLLVTAAYLLMGFVWNLWHPGWIIFIAGAAVEEAVRAIFKEGFFSNKSHCGGAIGSAVFIAAVAAYLVVGFTCGLWHPTWLIFIVAVAIDAVIGVICIRK